MVSSKEALSRRAFLLGGASFGLLGAIRSLASPRGTEAGGGSECVITPDVRPFIIDYEGREVEIPTEVFTKVVHNPQFAFGFDLNRGDYLREVRSRINEVRGFAVKGRPEMLNRSPLVLPEDEPQNQIPVETILEDRRLLVRAKDPEGFPAGSQISVMLPISPDPRSFYVMRTFTEGAETEKRMIKTPAIVGVVYLERGGAGDFFWSGRFTDLYPQFLGEPGIQGMTVDLQEARDARDLIGSTVATVETNENGVYVFEGVNPGRYRVGPRLFSGVARTQGNPEVIVSSETTLASGVIVGIKPEDLPDHLRPKTNRLFLPQIP
ncbi:MAG: hypothetical protein HYZ02_00210 [Candidatus Levybacteria bacterium]|nr:hypothetical protein [Candidatus Levybacteria bacterium]